METAQAQASPPASSRHIATPTAPCCSWSAAALFIKRNSERNGGSTMWMELKNTSTAGFDELRDANLSQVTPVSGKATWLCFSWCFSLLLTCSAFKRGFTDRPSMDLPRNTANI